MYMQQKQITRPAYSLVELLVVIGIILGVMGMVMAIYPSYNQREEMYKSADIVRNSLMQARQWAIRDKAITGIEFGTLLGKPGVSLTFVQSPPILGSGDTQLKIQAGGSNTELLLSKSNTFPIFNPLITIDDYIISDNVAQITLKSDEPNYIKLTLSNPITNATQWNGQSFKILRKPATIPSEPVLDFSKSPGIVVDLYNKAGGIVVGPDPLTGPNGTLLFNANGQCMPKNTGIITIKVVQTDPGTPYIKPAPDAANSNVVLTLVEHAALANVAINETYIIFDAATGISKVLGGKP